MSLYLHLQLSIQEGVQLYLEATTIAHCQHLIETDNRYHLREQVMLVWIVASLLCLQVVQQEVVMEEELVGSVPL